MCFFTLFLHPMSIHPEYHKLNNGIRLVHMPTQSPVAHLGVFINAGSRDEPEGISGLAHFIEHMIFKGTKKRKAYHVLNRLESVGGELNAFTTKEYTCIYTSFLNTWYSRAAELLADIVFNSTFPVREIRKEKDLVCRRHGCQSGYGPAHLHLECSLSRKISTGVDLGGILRGSGASGFGQLV